ncbi:GNAT family N-acetyltransferase [Pseudonocardia kunmingensis]|uniref:Acetyltransferase (GNAT) family protein n=1 Tax=Pseudonocardia kunmingensis TaxID=630975 RepID=A0A543E1N6_9PSEU|nr:GNAT family N-acetyltransferase [Pseudonocardia kunmingensis]TQM15498.1 acetyltransferase (GNAT) family protein [Pseudonocardia kunmingensis]
MDERAVSRTSRRFWSLGADVLDLGGATAVRSPAAPGHPLGTFLCEVRTAEPAGALVEFARRTRTPCPRVLVDPDTPPAAEAHLALHGWRLDVVLQLVLPAGTAVGAPAGPVRPVTDDAGWAHVQRLFRIDHLEEDTRLDRPARSAEDTAAAVALRRRLGVAYLLAERSGEVAGCIASWPGDEGVGMIEDVFVHPDHRRLGVATDLLRHAVGHARAHGAGPVLIGAEVDDTPKHLYARFGFRPATVARSYEAPPA